VVVCALVVFYSGYLAQGLRIEQTANSHWRARCREAIGVADMRLDEVSVKYAEFGDFYVGKIIPR